MNLSNELVLARFEQEFPGVVKATETGIDGMLAIEIDHKQVVEVLRKMRDDSVLQFNFLSSLNGMHFPQNEGRELGVVYHLHNWVKNFRMRNMTSSESFSTDTPICAAS